MPWMKVMMVLEGGGTIENVVNTDTISRFGPLNSADGPYGSYIKFSDGSTIHVADPMQEITDVVLQADAKKAK